MLDGRADDPTLSVGQALSPSCMALPSGLYAYGQEAELGSPLARCPLAAGTNACPTIGLLRTTFSHCRRYVRSQSSSLPARRAIRKSEGRLQLVRRGERRPILMCAVANPVPSVANDSWIDLGNRDEGDLRLNKPFCRSRERVATKDEHYQNVIQFFDFFS